jgi:HPt (histidine-containing phosphotransfer) domain-containing protein
MSNRERMRAAIEEMWLEARPRIMARVAVLQSAATAIGDGRLDPALRVDAEGEAHKLAGSLGMFGYADASVLAHDIEALLEGDGPVGPELVDLVGRLVGELPAS